MDNLHRVLLEEMEIGIRWESQNWPSWRRNPEGRMCICYINQYDNLISEDFHSYEVKHGEGGSESE